jgi:hypothetical protein
LENISSPIWLFFCYWGEDREAAEVILMLVLVPSWNVPGRNVLDERLFLKQWRLHKTFTFS